MAEVVAAELETGASNGTSGQGSASSGVANGRYRLGGPPAVFLVVEDNSVERAVLSARLSRAFPDATVTVAAEAHELVEHLRRPRCDVVVTDYWLGWSDGLSVLQRSKRRWPNCRVIMLTGNGGEDLASQALKLGLHAYLLKPEGLEGLIPAVESAVEIKRREEWLELHGSIVTSLPEAVFSTCTGRTVTSWNLAAERLYGYSAEEIVGREADSLVAPHMLSETLRIEGRVLEGEAMTQVPSVHVRKDGKRIDVSIALAPIRNEHGEIDGVARIVRHIYR